MKYPRAFLMIDTLSGLVLIMTLALALALSVDGYQKACRRLDNTRMALGIAENVLADLQSGRPGGFPAAPAPAEVRLERLKDDPAPAGKAWLRVTVKYKQGEAHLIGLVAAGGPEGSP